MRIQPEFADGFQKMKCANHIGVDEISGGGNGAIDVRLGGEVQDVSDAVLLQSLEHIVLVSQIDFFKAIFGMTIQAGETFEMTGIGQAIEVHQAFDLGFIDKPTNCIGTDKAGTACYEKAHGSNQNARVARRSPLVEKEKWDQQFAVVLSRGNSEKALILICNTR